MQNMEIPVSLPAPSLRSGGLLFDVAIGLDLEYQGHDRTGVGVRGSVRGVLDNRRR